VLNIQNNKRAFRAALLASGALLTMTTAALAAGDDVETVVVTGSLIQRSAGDAPTPTMIVGADLITKTGQTNIANVLQQLPQVQNAGGLGDLTPLNSNFLTSGFGVSNVDLRSLGASRTLVLVNGRRQVTGSPTSSAVDLNTIPTQLISRVEVITGGSSAIYGSDAVAGVVNIILKDDFEGLIANAQAGSSSRGDGGDVYGAVTLGSNFANDKGNVTISVTIEHSGSIQSNGRDLTATDETALPGLFPVYGTHGNLFFGSAFSSFGLGGRFQDATPNGVGIPQAFGKSYNPDGTVFNTAVDGYDRNPNRYIQVPLDRRVFAQTGHYDVTDNVRFFVETTYAETHSAQQLEPYPGASTDGLSAPSSSGGTGILIPYSNPFISPALIAAVGSQFPGGVIPATDPGLFFSRRFADLGDRTGEVDRNMGKITLGFDGSLWDDWKWNTYYEWGRTSESQTNSGFYDKIKMQNALNARAPLPGEVAPAGGGGFVCSDPIAQAAGCVPINLFGAGSITPQAAGYVGSLVTIQDKATEQVAQLTANGTIWNLPAGGVKLAVGGEYRDERAAFVPDAASQAGTVAGNQQSAISGAFNVKEAFGEILIPVLKDLPFAQYLEVSGAIRYSHYSTAGNATSWNFGGTYQPIDDLKFRAAEASATRAPNIAELFSPKAQTFPSISKDPCSNPASANIAANCALQIAAIGPGFPGEPAAPTYTGATGQAALQGVGGNISGNPNLVPETAHTFTAGAVYTPSWVDGVQATIDYFDIRLNHAIGSLAANDTLNACYSASPTLFATNIFCQQILRQHDSVLGPIIKQVNFPTFNLGSIKTSGVDGNLTYAFDMGDWDDGLKDAGSWTLTLNTTYLDSYKTDPGVIGTTPIIGAGTIGLEHWKGLLRATYAHDALSVTTTIHYVGSALIDKSGTVPIDDPGNKVPAFYYLDLNVNYNINEWGSVYVGANNLFDTRPPEIYPGSGLDTTGTGTDADVYDPIGLFVYAGVNIKV
jgi:outer membrane receptor protein involved in Fe transport